jgi:hypothetical protein
MKAQAMGTAISLLQTRSLAVAQQSISTAMPLLVILIFWFTINFISLGLFAPRNGTVITTLFVCALAVSRAIFLILELSNPLGGIFRISSAPLRARALPPKPVKVLAINGCDALYEQGLVSVDLPST